MSSFRYRSAVATVALMASLSCLPTSVFASINITSAYTYAAVYDAANSAYNYDDDYTFAGALTTATLTGFSSTHNSVYGQSGFSHTLNQVRQGGQDDYSQGYGYVYFTAQNNDTYSISGSFANSAGYGYIAASLYDITSDATVYFDSQVSNGPANLSLTGAGLSGSLIANHNYEWVFNAYTYALAGPDNGAAASGTASIRFGNVPEPSSLLIWGTLGLVGLVGSRRRKVC